MRNGVIASLMGLIVAIPAVAAAQEPAGAGVRLRTPPAMRHAPPPGPHGWQSGGASWWRGGYRPPIRGFIMPSYWLSPNYVVSNWGGYGFAEPGWGRRWVRYYDDAVLVDGRGVIYDSIHDVSWDRHARGPVPEYVGDQPDEPAPHGADYDYRDFDDQVTWDGGRAWTGNQIWAWPSGTTSANGSSVIVVPAGSVTTIVVQSQPVVTTTTTTYYDEAAPRWHAAPQSKVRARSYDKPRVVRRVPVKKG